MPWLWCMACLPLGNSWRRSSAILDYVNGMCSPLPLFPVVKGEVLPATSSSPHLIVFNPRLSLVLFSQSSSSPVFLTSLLSQSPVSALASLVSSCPPHVTRSLSSSVCHPPSCLRVLPTVVCSSPVSLSSYSALHSLPLTPPFFSCYRTFLRQFKYVQA